MPTPTPQIRFQTPQNFMVQQTTHPVPPTVVITNMRVNDLIAQLSGGLLPSTAGTTKIGHINAHK